MANIVRMVLPDGPHKFKPFTVEDYRDFLLIRNDLTSKSEKDQKIQLEDLLDDYFSEFPKAWRPYIFINVFTSSIGKTKIPIAFTCPKCGASKRFLFNLSQEPLKNPIIETSGVKIQFKFPEEYEEDPVKLIENNIYSVNDGTEHLWESLSVEDKITLIESIDYSVFESIIKKLRPLNFELNFSCCDKHKSVYDEFISIFKLLLNPDEVFTFYQINHLLVKSHYDLGSIMKMVPVERSIALSLVEKDLK